MTAGAGPEALQIGCVDGVALGGHLWRPDGPSSGTVIINPATGVLARYYHRYARFLAENGWTAITYDYRGIGLSRRKRLRGCGIVWRDWGERDFEAVLSFAHRHDSDGRLAVVGHSIGGVLIGFAQSAGRVDRVLTVGAQYAYWRDYAAARRAQLVLRWHVAMPILTAIFGFFPGRRLGWLEDLPAGVANEWSFRGADMARSYPATDRAAIGARFAAVRAPILAVSTTDDDFATEAAIRRTLSRFPGAADRRIAILAPVDLGQVSIGHFALFHDRFRDTFWPATLRWIAEGVDPFASTVFDPKSGQRGVRETKNLF